jgi:predicted nucleotidyltransferase
LAIAIDTFISDFKKSGIIEWLSEKYDIIFIWITGSRAVNLDDSDSDYDLGILVADKIETPRDHEHITSGKYLKDPEKYIHFRVNTLKDVYSYLEKVPFIFYDYLGWAQFGSFDESHIIYSNPKYQKLLDELVVNKNLISKRAAYAYLTVFDPVLTTLANGLRPEGVLPKFIAYFLLCLNILSADSVSHELLLKIKQTPVEQLTSDDFALIVSKAKTAKQLISELTLPELHFESFDAWW